MNINLKGAASNTLEGIKGITEILDNYDGEVDSQEAQDIIDQINEIIIKYQPQLGAFCILEHFNEQGGDGE